MPTERDIRLRAAELLERDGWCQGFNRVNGRRCLVQALCDAGNPVFGTPDSENVEFNEAWKKVYRATGGRGLATWNDQPGRMLSEVLKALRDG